MLGRTGRTIRRESRARDICAAPVVCLSYGTLLLRFNVHFHTKIILYSIYYIYSLFFLYYMYINLLFFFFFILFSHFKNLWRLDDLLLACSLCVRLLFFFMLFCFDSFTAIFDFLILHLFLLFDLSLFFWLWMKFNFWSVLKKRTDLPLYFFFFLKKFTLPERVLYPFDQKIYYWTTVPNFEKKLKKKNKVIFFFLKGTFSMLCSVRAGKPASPSLAVKCD